MPPLVGGVADEIFLCTDVNNAIAGSSDESRARRVENRMILDVLG
jgi:hypothetical protein